MRKFIKGLLIGFCCLLFMNIQAEIKTGQIGDEATYRLDTETKTMVINGSGSLWNMGYYGERRQYGGDLEYIEYVTIEEGITEIPYNVFTSTALKEIHLPQSLKSLGNGPFQNCKRLKEIEIPSGVERTGGWIFFGCDSLIKITNRRETPQPLGWNNGYDTWDGLNRGNATLFVPHNAVEAYKKAEGWKEFARIEAIRETIGSNLYCTFNEETY